jgi:hypothetical protein
MTLLLRGSVLIRGGMCVLGRWAPSIEKSFRRLVQSHVSHAWRELSDKLSGQSVNFIALNSEQPPTVHIMDRRLAYLCDLPSLAIEDATVQALFLSGWRPSSGGASQRSLKDITCSFSPSFKRSAIRATCFY